MTADPTHRPGTQASAPDAGSLLERVPAALPAELVTRLAGGSGVRIERIVSTGQASPPGFWYDQDDHEWVALVSGAAGLRFEAEPEPRRLAPGDWLLIPARCRHRVEWTAADPPTVWLAVFFP